MLHEREAAGILGLSTRYLQKMRFERRGPAYVKLGKAVRYRREDLEAYLSKHRIDPEA